MSEDLAAEPPSATSNDAEAPRAVGDHVVTDHASVAPEQARDAEVLAPPTARAEPAQPERAPSLADTLLEPAAQKGALTALVAWSLTVAPAAFAHATPAYARVLAIVAVSAGVLGPPLAVARPRAGRHLGISAFLALSTAVWLASPASIDPLRLEPVRAALGTLAWGLYALGWRGPKPKLTTAAPDPAAPALQARSSLPSLAVPLAALGALAALACLALAWRAREPERALFAQGAAVACAVALVTASGIVATSRGRPRASSRRIPPGAIRSLLLLAAVALAGVVVLLTR